VRYDATFVYISVEDSGVGVEGLAPLLSSADGAFPLFLVDARAAPARAEVDYKYSREFGAPFSGLGLGLVRADVIARLHGGRLSLSMTDAGTTTACLSLLRDGSATDLGALAGI
jgi:hypothetical protein